MNQKHKINEALVKQFANGDMKAFDSIYSIYNHKLQKFIFSLVKSEPEAEDLVHEVFVKVWENKEKLKNYSSFSSYLFSIAYNTTISFLRVKAKNSRYIEYIKSIQIEIDEPDFPDNLNINDLHVQLDMLIEKMPPRQREIFKMKHLQGCSYKEIAEKLNISVNTVENHMVKAHKFLKTNSGKAYLPLLFFLHLFL